MRVEWDDEHGESGWSGAFGGTFVAGWLTQEAAAPVIVPFADVPVVLQAVFRPELDAGFRPEVEAVFRPEARA